MKRARGGFTLLEIMVTLVIVAMFSSAVYAMFLRAVVDTRSVQETTAAGRLCQSILNLIERDLAGCLPASEELPHFAGGLGADGAAELEFLTAVDARAATAAAADLVRVAYVTRPGEEAEGPRALYRREAWDAAGGVEERWVLLDRSVKEFALEYYDGTDWHEAWSEPEAPRAVRVTLVLKRRLQLGGGAPAADTDFTASAVAVIPAGA
ncbi:MAG TPA: type II secretion system protein GspJ [Planctomycetota bacterium]|jgi:prepilin-type N-terminal cleavage/methylation domain-containing protein|nr:prepilin-type N-terminal cleavage/methylation domain-containing protein [Planctomycetota bacterium]OQC21704.1 MAG: Pseudopilin GspJ [Planctomycetes bacterium ADurb.Bin069]HNR98916.1 type II secretion system protein GspJ [Planctomycetota bacterium]HNU26009.1 type II secretion system protein GspJ [Planctomycetota bacterium]HOE29674.1 type II secretion system protein GspJ [Planctomycetota bacterium]